MRIGKTCVELLLPNTLIWNIGESHIPSSSSSFFFFVLGFYDQIVGFTDQRITKIISDLLGLFCRKETFFLFRSEKRSEISVGGLAGYLFKIFVTPSLFTLGVFFFDREWVWFYMLKDDIHLWQKKRWYSRDFDIVKFERSMLLIFSNHERLIYARLMLLIFSDQWPWEAIKSSSCRLLAREFFLVLQYIVALMFLFVALDLLLYFHCFSTVGLVMYRYNSSGMDSGEFDSVFCIILKQGCKIFIWLMLCCFSRKIGTLCVCRLS